MHQRIHTSRFSLAVLAIILISCVNVRAETIVLDASKDNTLFNDAAGSLSNGTGPLFVGRTGGQGPGALRTVLAFDLASEIPAGSMIEEIQLTLQILKGGNGSGNESFTLHRLEQDWGEGTSNTLFGSGATASTGDATWLHTFHVTDTWNNPGGDFESSPSASKSIGTFGPETWGSTPEMVADAQGWLDDPSSNYGWILIGDESAFASARQIASRELINGPQLTVTFRPIPEPATMALGLLAVFGGTCCMRRCIE